MCALFLLGFFDLWPKVLRSPIGWIYGIHFEFKFNMHHFPKSVWTLARKLTTALATLTLDMSHIAQPIIRLRACANSCVSWTPGTTSSHLCQLMSVICVLTAAVATHRPATSAWNDVARSCCHRLHSFLIPSPAAIWRGMWKREIVRGIPEVTLPSRGLVHCNLAAS